MNISSWNQMSSIPGDATIAGICCEANGPVAWVASPSGLFCGSDVAAFELKSAGSTGAVLALGKSLISAQYAGGILYSPNRGSTWYASRLERPASQITCFAASPNFQRDVTILAGSDGDGIFRSTDGGASWWRANFGLRSLNIFALGWAPAWQAEHTAFSAAYIQEIVFAASDQGVYFSPNGGRAWRICDAGLPDVAVLSLAVSSNFKRSPISRTAVQISGAVFAGTDGNGLHRSLDGGQTWQAMRTFPGRAVVNDLQFDQRGWLWAATGQEGVLVSPDQGETWRLIVADDLVNLCLAVCDKRLWVGTAENGLWSLEFAELR